jgi:hypothetical protein
MLRDLMAEASALLQLRDATALRAVEAAMGGGWRDELAALLEDSDWHAQLIAAAALAIGGQVGDEHAGIARVSASGAVAGAAAAESRAGVSTTAAESSAGVSTTAAESSASVSTTAAEGRASVGTPAAEGSASISPTAAESSTGVGTPSAEGSAGVGTPSAESDAGLSTAAAKSGAGVGATAAESDAGLSTAAAKSGAGVGATADQRARMADPFERLWRAIDGASWIAPQLIACAFLGDSAFIVRAEERLLGVERRPPKTIGALVRAYHRLPSPRLPVVAQLRRHDGLLPSEEARVGVRGVDAWLDRLPALASDATRARWIRQPR